MTDEELLRRAFENAEKHSGFWLALMQWRTVKAPVQRPYASLSCQTAPFNLRETVAISEAEFRLATWNAYEGQASIIGEYGTATTTFTRRAF